MEVNKLVNTTNGRCNTNMQIEFSTTSYGKKVPKIPKEELQLLELKVEFLPDSENDAEFFCLEFDRLMQIVAEKYGGGMKFFDVKEQYRSIRRKSVWKLFQMPTKELFALGTQIKTIPRDNLEHFRAEYDKIVQGIAKKYLPQLLEATKITKQG